MKLKSIVSILSAILGISAVSNQALAIYCEAGIPKSWSNCIEGSAKGNDIRDLGSVVLSHIALPSSFQAALGVDNSVTVVANNQVLEIGTRTGDPSVITDVRYDQEISPVPGVEISQTKKLGVTTSSCYRNALNVCMKNSNQQVELTTTLKVNGKILSATESTSEPRGEVFGFFCCRH